MGRLIWWVLIALAIGWWWRRVTTPRPPPAARGAQEAGTAGTPTPPRLHTMVRCARCGVHLPETDAVKGTDGAYYCGTAHRDLAAAASDRPHA